MFEPREIDLRDRAGDFALRARLVLDVYSEFPKDDASRAQAMLLLDDEIRRFNRIGAKEYRPSWLSDCVLKGLWRRVARRTLAGCVAVVMVALDNVGRRVSLEAAAKIVSEFGYAEGKGSFLLYGAEKGWTETKKPLIGDLSTIKTCFREYRPSAHICAAQVVCADYLEPLMPFDSASDATEYYLATVLHYQKRLRCVPNHSEWQSWVVRASPPPNVESIVPLQPTLERLEQLLMPWLRKEFGDVSHEKGG